MSRKRKSRAGYVRDGVDDRDLPDHVSVVGSFARHEPKALPPPPVPPDPKRVAAAVAAMTQVSLGLPETFDAPFNIVVANNGIFRVQKTVLGEWVTKLDGLPTVTDKMDTGFHLAVPKIPFATVCQIYTFFKKVCEKAKRPVEAYCQVWYAREGNLWFLRVPEQDVSGASVVHKATSSPTENCIHVADVHSHGSMGAFFSGTDDADEKRQGVRIFGVIGDIPKNKPSMKWRIGRGDGTFLDVEPASVVDLETVVDLKVSAVHLLTDSVTLNVSKINPWVPVEIPQPWLDAVTTESQAYVGGGAYYPRTEHDGYWRNGHFISTKDDAIWEEDPRGGWRRTDQRQERVEAASLPTARPSFHTLVGTFTVEKDRLLLHPIVGDHGLGGVRA